MLFLKRIKSQYHSSTLFVQNYIIIVMIKAQIYNILGPGFVIA